MNALISIQIHELFLVFTRIAFCMVLLPGFSSTQVSPQIKIFAMLALSFAAFPFVKDEINLAQNITPLEFADLVVTELIVACVLALPVRFLFLALSSLGEITMQLIGLNPIPGIPIGDDQATTTLSALINITAIVLFFSTGLHLMFVAALINSFSTIPAGGFVNISVFVESIAIELDNIFSIILRLSAPILIYSTIINLVAGITNKLTPQVPVYFVSTPFLICGGLVILSWLGDDMLFLFNMEVTRLINEIL